MTGYIIHTETDGDYLVHHGIKGMRWGVRRYQNEDGSLTSAGEKRYNNAFSLKATGQRVLAKNYELNEKTYSKSKGKFSKTMASANRAAKNAALKKAEKYQNEANRKKQEKIDYKQTDEYKAKQKKVKKAIKIGAAVAGTALAAYGAYKLNKFLNEKVGQEYSRKGKEYAEYGLKARDLAFKYDGYIFDARKSNNMNAVGNFSYAKALYDQDSSDYLNKARSYYQKASERTHSLGEKYRYIRGKL